MTRVALFPWVAAEVSARPAVEAMINGIPVVTSDRGSAIDALGRSGLVLPLPRRLSASSRILPSGAEMSSWVEAIIQLWDDPLFYEEHRRLAFAEAKRLGKEKDGITTVPCPPSPPTGRERCVVLVPYVDRIEDDCERGLNQLEVAGVRVARKPGCSAIDLARCEMASDAMHDGAESILFIDSDIGFDAADALRLLGRSEPVVAGVYAKKNERDLACIFAEGTKNIVFGTGAPWCYLLKYASAGFLHSHGRAADHDSRFAATALQYEMGPRTVAVLHAALGGGAGGGSALSRRGLGVLSSAAANRHHSDRRHFDQAVPPRLIRVWMGGCRDRDVSLSQLQLFSIDQHQLKRRCHAAH